jgi:hypothetical protein
MKRSELKNIIKPLVKECITETLIEEGLLSSVVSEVVKGMSPVITESSAAPIQDNSRQIRETRRRMTQEMKENRKQLLDAIGNDAYGGVDLFEGTKPAAPEMSATQAASPLANKDPSDAGVDISNIVALGGKNWKALIG